MAAALALAWALVVVGGAARRHPASSRRVEVLVEVLADPPAGSTPPASTVRRLRQRVDAAWAGIGRRLAAHVGHEVDPATARRIGGAAATAALAAAVWLPLGVVVGGCWFVMPWWRGRRTAARRREAVIDELPDVADLFHLAAGAGLTVRLSVEEVATRSQGVLAQALGEVVAQVAVGSRMGDSLDRLRQLGEPVRPLVDALQATERHGVPLVAPLARVAAEARRQRRRRAEEKARRVPVKLLFPLVLCTLPAFGLLTVVPMLVGAFRHIRL